MEGFTLFLILVLIILLIIFHSSQASKFRKLHDHINFLQKQIQQSIKEAGIEKVVTVEKKQETTAEKVIVPEKKVDPPVIKKEEVIIEKKEEVPPVTEKKEKPVIEPVHVSIPVIQDQGLPLQRKPVAEPQPSFWERFKEKNPDLEKFIGENLLSKIAITILVLGIAFFVKYSIDKGWINETARAGIGILVGSAIMVIAHRLHKKFKAFSSVLVAGAIAIFYFTIAIAFHEYHLFSQTVAFVIMFVITGFSVFISVAYDRVELAALSITGGFSVPFMLSTGEGNYKVLFTYILILDTGMLVLAYLKKWNLINILAYAFTVLLYTAWLGTKVIGEEHAPYAGAFLFGCIFYLVFVLMNVVNNVKEKRQFSYPELIILISNTFVFYISGMLVLREWAWEYKGLYTVIMGVINLALAVSLYKYLKSDKRLVYLFIGLALTFATLAAPVQLKGNYITLFWAAEAALLIWLSQRAQLKAFKFASVFIVTLAFFSLIMDEVKVYNQSLEPVGLLTNKAFITGIFTSLALFTGVFFLSREQKSEDKKWYDIDAVGYGYILKIMAVFVAWLTGLLEVIYQGNQSIWSSDSVMAMTFFYHIAFSSILSIVLMKRYTASNNIISFILLLLNLLIYCFAFTNLPYNEIIDRSNGTHGSYIAYAVHFGALLAIAAHTIVQVRAALRNQNFIVTGKSGLLWALGFFIIVFLSNEVLLNSMTIKMDGFVRNSQEWFVRDIYELVRLQVIKVGLPIAWGLAAFMFLSVGIRRQLKAWRIMSLVLLAITLLKLFIFDIREVGEAGKIIAFIILGLLLLVMSFMYAKIKAIILDEEKTEPPNPEITNENPNP